MDFGTDVDKGDVNNLLGLGHTEESDSDEDSDYEEEDSSDDDSAYGIPSLVHGDSSDDDSDDDSDDEDDTIIAEDAVEDEEDITPDPVATGPEELGRGKRV